MTVWRKLSGQSPSDDYACLCPALNCTAVHWKPNMRQHYTDLHPGLDVPEEFKISVLDPKQMKRFAGREVTSVSTLSPSIGASIAPSSGANGVNNMG